MSTIEWIKPSMDLRKLDQNDLLQKFAERLKKRCEAAYVFGSFADGTYHSESDIDLVIIKTTDKLFTERALEFTDLFDIFSRLDILVYTPAEFERMNRDENGFFSTVKRFQKIEVD